MSQNKKTPAHKAAATKRTRKEFIERFGARTFDALRKILGARNTDLLHFTPGSLAAFKANLTRGAYNQFVSVNATGKVVKNTLRI